MIQRKYTILLILIILISVGLVGSILFGRSNQKATSTSKTKRSSKKSVATADSKDAMTEEETTETQVNQGQRVVIETNRGRMVLELYPDVAPKTVDNFVKLAQKGFYNGLTWHRVVPGFVIQGGDPNGDGSGGPGYQIPAEFNSKSHIRGTLAMARSQQPDSAGSQFYICLAPQPSLDGNYTIFGQVVEGIDVIDKIEMGDLMERVFLEPTKPE